jgi:molybdenum cofactor cytidylyltransferase
MSEDTLFAVVLAAGASTRFGRTKQLEPFDGQSMVANAVRKAEAVCGANSVLVTGNRWQEVVESCEPLSGFFVVNDDYQTGLASSIACGVAAVRESAAAILLLLADLPLVTTDHLALLARNWRQSPGSIIASAFDGTLGPPIVFPSADFDALQQLRGDNGARPVIDANLHRVLSIACEEAAFDVDRPEDLAGIY